MKASLPGTAEDHMELELRSNTWVPRDHNPGSQDGRTLGVQGFQVLMKAVGTTNRVFEVNAGSYR
jgi:hypothetical protein